MEADGDTKLSGGNFVIDDTGGVEKFSVSAENGNVTAKGNLDVTGAIVGSATANFAQSCHAAAFVALCDERLKKDLKVLLKDLRLFRWFQSLRCIDTNGLTRRDMGTARHLVSLLKRQKRFILASAMNELNKQVQELKAEVASLKAEKAAAAAATEAPAEAPA